MSKKSLFTPHPKIPSVAPVTCYMFFLPSPGSGISHNADGQGMGVDTIRPPAPCDSKLTMVELREKKKQSLGLDGYSQVLLWSLTLSQYLTQLWWVKAQISATFRKNLTFSNLRADIGKTIRDSAMELSRACSPDNL